MKEEQHRIKIDLLRRLREESQDGYEMAKLTIEINSLQTLIDQFDAQGGEE